MSYVCRSRLQLSGCGTRPASRQAVAGLRFTSNWRRSPPPGHPASSAAVYFAPRSSACGSTAVRHGPRRIGNIGAPRQCKVRFRPWRCSASACRPIGTAPSPDAGIRSIPAWSRVSTTPSGSSNAEPTATQSSAHRQHAAGRHRADRPPFHPMNRKFPSFQARPFTNTGRVRTHAAGLTTDDMLALLNVTPVAILLCALLVPWFVSRKTSTDEHGGAFGGVLSTVFVCIPAAIILVSRYL